MEQLIPTLAWLPAALVAVEFVGYCLLLLLAPRRAPPADGFEPQIDILVPAYDEALHIEEKLRNLLDSDYPAERYQIVVVDDGSGDRTAERVLAFGSDRVRLLRLSVRSGKVAAICAGLEACESDIVVGTDATSRIGPKSISRLVAHFQDPQVGGVTCRVAVMNRRQSLATRCQSFILQMQNSIKAAESALDSAAGFSGPLYAYRRSALGPPSPATVLEDRIFAIQVRRNGYRVRYADDAPVFYHSAGSQPDFGRQKSRIMGGAFESLWRFWPMLWNPRFGLYGLLILPEYVLFRLLRPFLLLLSGAFLLALAVQLGPRAALAHTLGIGLMLGLSLGVACLALAPRVHARREFASDALLSLPAIPVLLGSALTGALRVLLGRHSAVWHRVERSPRERR